MMPAARGEHGGLERGFHRLETRVAEQGLAGGHRPEVGVACWTSGFRVLPADLGAVQRSNVIRLSSRANSALSRCGCTSPIACSSRAICAWPALTTRGSRDRRLRRRRRREIEVAASFSVPHMGAAGARPNDGQEPSGSRNVTFRDSKRRRRSRVLEVLGSSIAVLRYTPQVRARSPCATVLKPHRQRVVRICSASSRAKSGAGLPEAV